MCSSFHEVVELATKSVEESFWGTTMGEIWNHIRSRVGSHWRSSAQHSDLLFSIFSKAPEFSAWLVEERKINPETISKEQNKKEFAKYVEDYNTGVFPSSLTLSPTLQDGSI